MDDGSKLFRCCSYRSLSDRRLESATSTSCTVSSIVIAAVAVSLPLSAVATDQESDADADAVDRLYTVVDVISLSSIASSKLVGSLLLLIRNYDESINAAN